METKSHNFSKDSTGAKAASHGHLGLRRYLVTIKGFLIKLMADIRPFHALRYNLQRVSASQVVTQPYDKITPAMQEKYYAASPYNLVRIILGRREQADNTVENVYTRAAALGRQWRQEGILQRDSEPSIYAYSQAFKAPSGKTFERRGFIALGRVEDYSAHVSTGTSRLWRSRRRTG